MQAWLAVTFLMFCAFPKPLSKRSGLGLRVTSNDNLFAVICVQITRDIQNSNTAFWKESKSIKKLNKSFFFQRLIKKKKIVKEKFALPAPQFNMQNSQPVPSHQQDGSMQVHISRALCGPRALRHRFQVIETRWSMQMSWPKSCCVHSKQNPRHLQNGSESQEMKFPWSSWHLEAQWFKYISLKMCLCIRVLANIWCYLSFYCERRSGQFIRRSGSTTRRRFV